MAGHTSLVLVGRRVTGRRVLLAAVGAPTHAVLSTMLIGQAVVCLRGRPSAKRSVHRMIRPPQRLYRGTRLDGVHRKYRAGSRTGIVGVPGVISDRRVARGRTGRIRRGVIVWSARDVGLRARTVQNQDMHRDVMRALVWVVFIA